MSDAKHTPGPWRANERTICPRSRKWVQTDVRGGGEVVAICSRTRHTVSDDDVAEVMANARLIAAAPDLLAACEAAMEFLPKGEYPGGSGQTEAVRVRDLVRAAIAKAKGAPNQ
jgi:hypothetical protein